MLYSGSGGAQIQRVQVGRVQRVVSTYDVVVHRYPPTNVLVQRAVRKIVRKPIIRCPVPLRDRRDPDEEQDILMGDDLGV